MAILDQLRLDLQSAASNASYLLLTALSHVSYQIPLVVLLTHTAIVTTTSAWPVHAGAFHPHKSRKESMVLIIIITT